MKSIEDARRAGGPPLVLGGTAEGATGNDVATCCAMRSGSTSSSLPAIPTAMRCSSRSTARNWTAVCRAIGNVVLASRMARLRTAACKSCCSLPASRGIRNFLTFRPRASLRLATNPARWLRWPNCLIGCRGLSPRRPALPEDRAKALQEAFLAVHRDPAISRGSREIEGRRQPDRGRRGGARDRGHRGCTARTARIHEEAPGREQRRRLSVRAGVCRPQEPSVVLQVYAVEGGKLKARPHDAASLGAAVWIDLADPTGDEQSDCRARNRNPYPDPGRTGPLLHQ